MVDHLDIVLTNLQKVIPKAELAKIKKLDDFHQYLPLEIGGLTVSRYEGPNAETLRSRTNVVRYNSNTPAMGAISRKYSFFGINKYALESIAAKHGSKFSEFEYDEGLMKFDSFDFAKDDLSGFEEALGAKARGHTNVGHLFDQMTIMGPKGDPNKAARGPTPFHRDVEDSGYRLTTDLMSREGLRNLRFNHLVLCTEDSTGSGCPIGMLMDKAAAQPFVLDPTKKPQKRHHLEEAVRIAANLGRPEWRSLLMFPGTVYKRYDRPAPISLFKDEEAQKGVLTLHAKDRAIIAQSFASQIAEMVCLRPVQTAIQLSNLVEIDCKTPYHTSNTLADFGNWTRTGTGINNTSWESNEITRRNREASALLSNRFAVGADESGWDHRVNPQGWYNAFRIVRDMYPDKIRFGAIYSPELVVFDTATQARLESLMPGTKTEMEVKCRKVKSDGTTEEFMLMVEAEMFEIDTDTYLRRVFAGISGNDIMLGDVRFSGYKHVYDTGSDRDGKIQLGWGMRSGNWSTFLNNCLINLWKWNCFPKLTRHKQSRDEFRSLYGYDLPLSLKLPKKLFRGDDAVVCGEVDDAFAKLIRDGVIFPSQLVADLIGYSGGTANAKKQETSDMLGSFEVGFAQVFYNEYYPFGVPSWIRFMERMTFREEDEATGIDPITGQDLRHLIGDMGNWARINNLWGSFGKNPHPWREVLVDVWQDLDVPEKGFKRRLRPPADAITRQLLSNLFYSRQLRRGNAPPGSESLFNLWNTPLGAYIDERLLATSKLNGQWHPPGLVPSKDARPEWRARIKSHKHS